MNQHWQSDIGPIKPGASADKDALTQLATLAAVIAAFVVCPETAFAQGAREYGSRPIRVIVPVPAGGGTDIIARVITSGLGDSAGLKMIVDNRPGGGGVIGTETVARAAPDGYTLLFALASHTTTPFLNKVPYDPLNDFSPVSLAAINPLLVEVGTSLPVASVKELIALAKSKPGGLNAGIAGSGAAGHLATELFKRRTGTTENIVSVFYKGGEPAQVALLSGEVQLNFASLPTSMAYIKAGRVKILAAIAKKRLVELPDVPTFIELGIPVDVSPWYGILAPAKTPPAIVNRIAGEVVKLVARPEVIERLAVAGATPVGSTPEEFREKIKRDLDEFGKLIPSLGMKAAH